MKKPRFLLRKYLNSYQWLILTLKKSFCPRVRRPIVTKGRFAPMTIKQKDDQFAHSPPKRTACLEDTVLTLFPSHLSSWKNKRSKWMLLSRILVSSYQTWIKSLAPLNNLPQYHLHLLWISSCGSSKNLKCQWQNAPWMCKTISLTGNQELTVFLEYEFAYTYVSPYEHKLPEGVGCIAEREE